MDVVSRLRAMHQFRYPDDPLPTTYTEAADLIESMATEIARLRHVIDGIDKDSWLHIRGDHTLYGDSGEELCWNDTDQSVMFVACSADILNRLDQIDA